MREPPKPPESPREDVERGGGAPAEGDVERAAEAGTDQAGAVSPELGPTSR